MHMAILFASYVNICTLQNKLTWENNYQHMMEFLINVHILGKNLCARSTTLKVLFSSNNMHQKCVYNNKCSPNKILVFSHFYLKTHW